MKTKLTYLFTLIVLLVLGGSPAKAQFVNFRLELPAGVNFASRVISPNPENPAEQMVWLELVATENMIILVDIRNVHAVANDDQAVFFLNNGTSDFALAKNIGMGIHSLQLDQSGLLIRSKIPKANKIKAWLGIPIHLGLRTKIEYL